MQKFLKTLPQKYQYQALSHYNKKCFSSGEHYDVAIIGGGPGGYVAAIKAAQLGMKTVCIEKRGSLGGTCLNVGCIPSKALLNISHKYEDGNKHFSKYGINVQGITYDWEKILDKKLNIVGSLTKGIEGLFAKNKVTYIKGQGTFAGKDKINVKAISGSDSTVSAKNIIIATGSEPTPFPGIPFDEKKIVSSTGALALESVPKKLVVIGGGVIGLEMGSVYQRMGSEVQVIEFANKICGPMDAEVSSAFQKILKKQGIKFDLSTKVVSGQVNGDQVQIVAEPVKGGNQKNYEADVVLVSTGRRPFTEGLGAKEIGINMNKLGQIEINSHFQTNIPNIYAIGDVVQGAMLAHKAEEEGIACIENLAGKGGHVNYNTIPGVIYTHPEVASVGKTEEELKAEGAKYKKGSFPFLANSRAKANDETDGLVKILTCATTDRILGAHIVGTGAGEMIAEAVIGMEYGAAAEDLGRTCHAHPTLSEAFKEACMGAYDKPIHF